MRMRRNAMNIMINDGRWHTVPNIETYNKQRGWVAYFEEEKEDYKLTSWIIYYICEDESIDKKYTYWTTNRLDLKNPNINPFDQRDKYYFDERFTSYNEAKSFVDQWNNDAIKFIETLETNPNQKLLTKYYEMQGFKIAE